MKTALVLLRTPFQASIVAKILDQEDVGEFDLLYFTQNNAEEDRYYFNTLTKHARSAAYCHAPVRRFDILGHMDWYRQARSWIRDHGCDLTIMASIDNYIFGAIAYRQIGSELITMDDGTANLFKAAGYYTDRSNRRGRAYRYLLGAYDLSEMKKRISRHYTLHPQFENIVSRDKLRSIQSSPPSPAKADASPITFFIGGPFEEVLTQEQIYRLAAHVRAQPVDYYIKHPREVAPLEIGAPFLDKSGLIAEDAIMRAAAGRPVHLIGWFSSVLFNIGGRATRRTMLLPKDASHNREQAKMAEAVGCETVFL